MGNGSEDIQMVAGSRAWSVRPVGLPVVEKVTGTESQDCGL